MKHAVALLLALLAPLTVGAQEPAGNPPRAVVAALQEAFATGDAATLHALGNPKFQAAITAGRLSLQMIDFRKECGEEWSFELDPAGWDTGGFQHLALARSGKCELAVRFSLDAAGHITGLFSQFAADERTPDSLNAELDAWQGNWGIAVMEFTPGEDEPVLLSLSKGRELFPIASIFKVYVLAEVARQIDAGVLSWDQPVMVREEWKSLPSGITHMDPDGTEHSLRVMVQRMIGISDNTATDHLMHLVGRDKLEGHLEEYFNSAPERNQPFPTTMEMFLLKGPVGASVAGGKLADLVHRWTSDGPAERRAVLHEMESSLAGKKPGQRRGEALMGYGVQTLTTPEHVEIEWLARPADVVRLFMAAARGQLVNPAVSAGFREGLAYGSRLYWRPGVSYHGFKGGNETGVLSIALLVMLEDGRVGAVCACRSGFPIFDIRVQDRTIRFASALLRAGLEGRLPAPAATGPR